MNQITEVLDASDFICWRDPAHDGISTTMFGWPQCAVCQAAPPYHDRPKYLVPGFALGLYVPLPSKPINAMIAPRSGIVGLPTGGDGDDARVHIYFEGWINGPMQYAGRDARGLWEAGVEHAASRMVTRYPTTAALTPRASELKSVGLYWPRADNFQITDEIGLALWLK